MNLASFGSLPASACTLGSEGSFGPDRIEKNVYNVANEVTQVRTAVGTADEAAEVSSTYTNNGQVQTLTDGENNKTTYEYDGHDRLARTFYPEPTKGAGASSTADYEQLSYDPNGNVTAFRNRAGETISYMYDNLDRLWYKYGSNLSSHMYSYNLLGWLMSTSGVSFEYDQLGRKTRERNSFQNWDSKYDAAGRRTSLRHPDGFEVFYSYLTTGELSKIVVPGPSWPGAPPTPPLATFGYDDLGRRTSLIYGDGTSTGYSYDPVSRLSQMTHDFAGTSHDLTLGYSYNPASQIVSTTRSNDLYAWTGHGSGTSNSPANGLNQLTSISGSNIAHDAKGNVTYDPTIGYGYAYSAENLLTMVGTPYYQGGLAYDGLNRLTVAGAGPSTKYFYDGNSRVAEFLQNPEGMIERQTARFVHGPGEDEPLVSFESSGPGYGLDQVNYLHADERGSIIATSSNGALTSVGRYDEYGKHQSFPGGRFGFAGMPYETVSDLYYARTRMYNPRHPRFMQPDSIGYGGGMNMYVYPTDPVNFTDPWGMSEIVVTGPAKRKNSEPLSDNAPKGIDVAPRGSSIAPNHNLAEELQDGQSEIVVTCDFACRVKRNLREGRVTYGILPPVLPVSRVIRVVVGNRVVYPPRAVPTRPMTIDRAIEIQRLKSLEAAKRLDERRRASGRWPEWINDVLEFLGRQGL
jgi:RHS repeat-associated protein